MAAIGDVIDGRYEILREIGRGGMSAVFLAYDRRLKKYWAVKEVRRFGNRGNTEVLVNSLSVEVGILTKLSHPMLPNIIDIIESEQTIYVVMDYIEGTSMDKVIAAQGPQSEAQVISWAIDICDALAYLHGQNPSIIYRDMKPANLMLLPDGRLKMIDFGIAREYKGAQKGDTEILGTRGYAPPEQYLGRSDRRSDIFALGMTMFNMLTGADPCQYDSYVPLRSRCPHLSAGIEQIIYWCVMPDPQRRWQDALSLKQALLSLSQMQSQSTYTAADGYTATDGAAAWQNGSSAGGTTPPVRPTNKQNAGNRKVLVISAIAAAVFLLVGGGYLITAGTLIRNPFSGGGKRTSNTINETYGDVSQTAAADGTTVNGGASGSAAANSADAGGSLHQDPTAQRQEVAGNGSDPATVRQADPPVTGPTEPSSAAPVSTTLPPAEVAGVTCIVSYDTPDHAGIVLRAGPGTSYEKLGVLPEGTELTRTGVYEGDYVSVNVYYQNQNLDGWVLYRYLTELSGGSADSAAYPTARISNRTDAHAGLVLRAQASHGSASLGVLPEGTLLYLLGETKNGYTFVRTEDGLEGWVLEAYLD